MKQILIVILLFFPFLFGFSQTGKLIHGKVLSGESPLSSIDIVNLASKKSATTDSSGNFSILAKVGDQLLIISNDYLDKNIILTQKEFDQTELIIRLEINPIALKEVEITTTPNVKFKVSQADLDEVKLAKQASTLKVLNVYDGTIENGIDFVRLGKDFIGLFKSKDKSEPLPPPIPFRDYLATNFTTDFYVQKLKLKPAEVDLFISYCEADPKSKTIAENQDLLKVWDFLVFKNEEFKKLAR